MYKQRILIFVLFFVAVLLIYLPAQQAGFVTDFLGWQVAMNTGTWKDALNTFGWHDNLPVMTMMMYWMYCAFGLNGFWWLLFSVLFHAINGLLAYSLFCRVLKKNSVKNIDRIALPAVILFLISPYQAEVLIWRVDFHYLLSTFFTLSILTLTITILESGRRSANLLMTLLFTLSLLTLELALATPLLIASVIIVWNGTLIFDRVTLRKFSTMILPQLVIIAAYFTWNKICLGSFVGHYGAGVHLNFDLKEILSNYCKYLLKYLLFTRYMPYNTTQKIYDFIITPPGIIAAVLFLSSLMFAVIRFQKLSNRLRMFLWSFIAFFIALIPVITLYVVTLLLSENDRYGYLASIFFWMAIVLALSALPTKFYFLLSGILITLSIYFTVNMVSYWNESNKVFQNLLSEFHWYDRNEVVILNTPDNYKGILMSRIYGDSSGFKEALALIRGQPFKGKMMEVTQFNMTTINDGVTVKQDSVNAITVTFNQWGNWWWLQGRGGGNYETDDLKVQFDGQSYHLQFKKLAARHAIIFQEGEHWKEFFLE